MCGQLGYKKDSVGNLFLALLVGKSNNGFIAHRGKSLLEVISLMKELY
jgi:hypothetical protein